MRTPTPILLGCWTSYQIFKRRSLDRISVFRCGCWKRGVEIFLLNTKQILESFLHPTFIHKIRKQFFHKSKLNKNNKAEIGIKSWTLSKSYCDVVGCSIIGAYNFKLDKSIAEILFSRMKMFLRRKKPSKNKNIEPH